MAANAAIAEVAGKRRLMSLDRGHRLEISPAGGPPSVIETRPVTEFSAAVDTGGRLHVAAWLLSRQLMYYTSDDGETFTRSTLLKSDGNLRLRDPLLFAGGGVAVVYVAETEYADTLVCYRYDGSEWDGRRLVEAEHPQRLAAYQFDGAPGPLCVLYGVKDAGRTVVMSKPVSDDAAPEVVAAVAGGLSDFCALTSGGARQACWISDGRLSINGLRQSDEPWSRTWPHFRRDEAGVSCLWMENGLLCGMTLGSQRGRVIPVNVRNAVPCMLALPGETRKSLVDGSTLREAQPHPEFAEKGSSRKMAPQPSPERPEAPRGKGADLTLSDVVRNQAVYLTRMQESLGSMERGMLKMQSEVNRLSREMSAVMAERVNVNRAKPAPQFSIMSVKVDSDAVIEIPEPPPEPDSPENMEDELSEPSAVDVKQEETCAVEPEESSEQPEVTESVEPEAPAEQPEVTEAVEPEAPVEPSEVTESVEPEEPAEPPEVNESVEPEAPAEPPEVTDAVEPAGPPEDEPDMYFPVT